MTIKFGPQIALRLKKLRPSPSLRWYLDEVVCSIGGKRMFLWCAVDDEGEVLDVIVQRRRDTEAALRLIRRLLQNQTVEAEKIVTDGLASFQAALGHLARGAHILPAGFEKTIERKLPPAIRRRERQQQIFKPQAPVQRFLATHAAIYNTFYTQRHLISRSIPRRYRAGAEAAWLAAVA